MTHAADGLVRNRAGSAAWVAYTSASAYTRVVAVFRVVVAPVRTPTGWPAPAVPLVNAASSRRSFASPSSTGSWLAKSVSARTSYEPKTQAAAFCGVIWMLPTVGVLSVTVAASANQAAETPADVTPFQVLEV